MASLRGGASMAINTTWQSCRETKYFLKCNVQCVGLVLFCFRVVRLFRGIFPPPISWLPGGHEYQTGFLHVHVLAPPRLAPEKQKLWQRSTYESGTESK